MIILQQDLLGHAWETQIRISPTPHHIRTQTDTPGSLEFHGASNDSGKITLCPFLEEL